MQAQQPAGGAGFVGIPAGLAIGDDFAADDGQGSNAAGSGIFYADIPALQSPRVANKQAFVGSGV
ncbi:hypothetical protein D3C86_2090370 [compost metagenome]